MPRFPCPRCGSAKNTLTATCSVCDLSPTAVEELAKSYTLSTAYVVGEHDRTRDPSVLEADIEHLRLGTYKYDANEIAEVCEYLKYQDRQRQPALVLWDTIVWLSPLLAAMLAARTLLVLARARKHGQRVDAELITLAILFVMVLSLAIYGQIRSERSRRRRTITQAGHAAAIAIAWIEDPRAIEAERNNGTMLPDDLPPVLRDFFARYSQVKVRFSNVVLSLNNLGPVAGPHSSWTKIGRHGDADICFKSGADRIVELESLRSQPRVVSSSTNIYAYINDICSHYFPHLSASRDA